MKVTASRVLMPTVYIGTLTALIQTDQPAPVCWWAGLAPLLPMIALFVPWPGPSPVVRKIVDSVRKDPDRWVAVSGGTIIRTAGDPAPIDAISFRWDNVRDRWWDVQVAGYRIDTTWIDSWYLGSAAYAVIARTNAQTSARLAGMVDKILNPEKKETDK